VRLISFVGCETATAADNLCTRAVDGGAGAGAALGFTDNIHSRIAEGQFWLQKYNDALAFGYSVDDAVGYADAYANVYRVEHGESSITDLATYHAVFGEGSTTITPL
jgi:hypothetical protein